MKKIFLLLVLILNAACSQNKIIKDIEDTKKQIEVNQEKIKNILITNVEQNMRIKEVKEIAKTCQNEELNKKILVIEEINNFQTEEIDKIKDANNNIIFNQGLILEGAKSTIKIYGKDLLLRNVIILFEAIILLILVFKKINIFTGSLSTITDFIKKIFKK